MTFKYKINSHCDTCICLFFQLVAWCWPVACPECSSVHSVRGHAAASLCGSGLRWGFKGGHSGWTNQWRGSKWAEKYMEPPGQAENEWVNEMVVCWSYWKLVSTKNNNTIRKMFLIMCFKGFFDYFIFTECQKIDWLIIFTSEWSGT